MIRTGGRARSVRAAKLIVPYLALVVCAMELQAQEDTSRSTREGVFSVTQAARGERSFTAHCSDCHELVEFTAADAYFASKEGEPLWEILDFIWSEMPEDAPAWLDPEEYIDILSYLLSAYGLPAGEEDLLMTRYALERIRLERPAATGS